MKKLLLSALLCGLIWLPWQHSRAQQPQTIKPQETVTTTAVLVDVVVKDRRGRVIKDLTADEFEVFEDGAKQNVDGFERISRDAGVLTNEVKEKAPERTAPVTPPAAPNTKPVAVRNANDNQLGATAMALVFDRLSPDARNRARQAALTYVGNNKELSAYTGVYAINLALQRVQPFTRDAQLVKAGVEKAGAYASTSYTSDTSGNAQATNNQISQALAASSAAAGAAGASNSGAGGAAGAAGVDAQLLEMQRRMAETYEVLERNQQGFSSVNSLMALVNAMATMPGRKALVYFSEGLAIPPDVAQQFRSVINAANRANVSIYTVDAAGLRAESTLAQTRNTVNDIAQRRQNQIGSSAPIVGDPLTKQLERNEDRLRGDPQSALTTIAQETGGTFIGNTSDIGEKLKEVDEDMSTYYLLSYAPTNTNYDGKFRNLSVKVKRSGVYVQARKGYYAVNTPGYVPVLDYETPALAVLAKGNPPITFPVQVVGTNFPDATRSMRAVIRVQVPTSAVTFLEDKDKKLFTTNFVIVVLIRDESHQVVGKLSRQYVLQVPPNKLQEAKNNVLFLDRQTDLPSGRYDLETIAYDVPTEKSSVKIGSINIEDPSETKLRVSSLSLIQRAIPFNDKTDSPYKVGEMMLLPNMTGVTQKILKQMAFYFVVYPAKGAKPPAEFTLQITQSGKSFANFPLKLEAPDAQGRIPFASGIPIDSLAPGGYSLRVTVKDEQGTSITRATPFMIEQ